ncbi:MAG: ethanolamine ammonia-lyase reactivating factor EutA [Oscillospiraceae bacterium]|nr:ethanolamine ammonia-lyase reactivating factor EutA [Oscillospiraceae bacterium]
MILSELRVENEASGFAVPKMQIADRKVLYRSPVHFTPLQSDALVDGEKLRQLILQEYKNAGISPEDVDTGAVIITGETSRKENASAVLEAVSGFAGDFVAATAGPDLESILAAKGAGAQDYSQKTGKTVLHMDIGGGTSNLALIRDGKIIRTGCLNVGGRLLKFEKDKVVYVSPVLRGLTDLQPGDYPAPGQVEAIAQILTHGLEMAAGLREATKLLDKLLTKETATNWEIPTEPLVISFSGGVADCIETVRQPGAFGDMGVELGQAIKKSRLCEGSYILGQETIRATVIGAGSHSAQLSGSTVFCRGIDLPLKNLPVAVFTQQEQDSPDLPQLICQRTREKDTDTAVLAFPGYTKPTYAHVAALADSLLQALTGDILVCLEADMAKALGQYLCLRLPEGRGVLCIDGVQPGQESFLDIGKPLGPALPVVIKTLVLEREYGT